MTAVVALAAKDLKLLLRDRPGLFFAFGFPLLMAVFFGTVFGGGGGGAADTPTGIAIAVVDEDGSPNSAAFVEKLDASDDYAVTRFEAREPAVDAVRRGRLSAAVVLTPDFGAASDRVFWGDPARVDLVYDPSRGAESAMLEGLLTRDAFERLSGVLTDTELMRQNAAQAIESIDQDTTMGPLAKASLRAFLGALDHFMAQNSESWMTDGEEGGPATNQMNWQPVVFDTVSVRDLDGDTGRPSGTSPASGYAVSFPQGVIWALIGVSAAFGISLVSERQGGTLRRLRIAPLTQTQVLAGKALACFVTTVAASAALLVLGRLVFGVIPTSLPLLALGVLCAGACFVGLMMLLSVLGKTEQAASGIGWGVLLLLGMFGGAMVPLFLLPGWMQSAASFSPVKWAVLAIEGPLWRGFSTAEMLTPCAVLLGVGVAAFTAGAWLFSRAEET